MCGRAACARPNLKTMLAVTPASASAPIITSSSICIEADRFSCHESDVASARGVVAGRGAGAALACGLSGGSAAAGPGSPATLITPEGSGQRDATGDDDSRASGAVARGMFWRPAAGAMPPIRGSALTLMSCSIRICGPVSSARASAIDLGTSGLGGGGAGLVATADDAACEGGERSCGAARAVLSLSARLYQHWRLVA